VAPPLSGTALQADPPRPRPYPRSPEGRGVGGEVEQLSGQHLVTVQADQLVAGPAEQAHQLQGRQGVHHRHLGQVGVDGDQYLRGQAGQRGAQPSDPPGGPEPAGQAPGGRACAQRPPPRRQAQRRLTNDATPVGSAWTRTKPLSVSSSRAAGSSVTAVSPSGLRRTVTGPFMTVSKRPAADELARSGPTSTDQVPHSSMSMPSSSR
jgi:hypothetical protein